MKLEQEDEWASSSSDRELDEEDDVNPLRCWDCNVNFTSRHFLYQHLFHHVRQPQVRVERVQLPSLRLVLKNDGSDTYRVVNTPPHQPASDSTIGEQEKVYQEIATEGDWKLEEKAEEEDAFATEEDAFAKEEDATVSEEEHELANEEGSATAEPEFASFEDLHSFQYPEEEASTSPETILGAENQETDKTAEVTAIDSNQLMSNSPPMGGTDVGTNNIPGAEPTPPPDPSPDYPKIRIKTTGLLKDPEQSLTITEITDENPDGDPALANSNASSGMWTTPSLEDPLKLPTENDDNNILSLFNNNERAKDLGFSTSENEFISLDRFDERNRGSMQLYNPNNSAVVSTQSTTSNTLESLTGLPMQALAQQVSRLQPSSGTGVHQQNVLINIQQFPSGPPHHPGAQPAYQPHPPPPHPPMYPHYPPHQPPMHQPYQPYQPPNMYYPPAPGYPPQHMGPPPPQPMGPMGGHQPPMSQPGPMPPMSQPSGMPQQQQQQQHQPPQGQQMPPSSQPIPLPQPGGQPPQGPSQNNQFRQPGPNQQPGNRPPGPRAPGVPQSRMSGPRGGVGPTQQRQLVPRARAPLMRPRGGGMVQGRGGMRPRMAGPGQNVRGPGPGHSPVKRPPVNQQQQDQVKKKRIDVLTPSDKDDDDCQVICMQPKNTDGGLPQIESVQGGTSEPAESSIMHLSDSITLSVRNPPPKPAPAVPQKSEAKAVANILATRGITVTATPKKQPDSPQKSASNNAPPTPALSLNGSVSIMPTAKSNSNNSKPADTLPTVDLTDDSTPTAATSPQKNRGGLPYRCDLCPAQYPNAVGLNKHRQSYHKTSGGMCELGIPLINLKQPGIVQKLSSMGINNYIPLPTAGPEGTFALPVISTRNPNNLAALGATQMLSLGPVRSIPKPPAQANGTVAARQPNK